MSLRVKVGGSKLFIAFNYCNRVNKTISDYWFANLCLCCWYVNSAVTNLIETFKSILFGSMELQSCLEFSAYTIHYICMLLLNSYIFKESVRIFEIIVITIQYSFRDMSHFRKFREPYIFKNVYFNCSCLRISWFSIQVCVNLINCLRKKKSRKNFFKHNSCSQTASTPKKSTHSENSTVCIYQRSLKLCDP